MSKLLIVRGLPGSGKSTLAKKIWENSCFYDEIFETDMYFMKNDEYNFDATKLYNAHKWCYEKVYENLHYEYNVIVANTFTTMKEMTPYLELMEVFDGLDVEVIEMSSQFESVHDVPQHVIDNMRERWQPVDPSWISRGVVVKDSKNVTI